MGKQWPAYLVAQAILELWQASPLVVVGGVGKRLEGLQHSFQHIAPEGVFVELVAAEADDCGKVEVASAGAGMVLIRRDNATQTERIICSGGFLGDIHYPDGFQTQPWSTELAVSDELALISDGFVNQHVDDVIVGSRITDLLNDKLAASGSLAACVL